jgi:thermitase
MYLKFAILRAAVTFATVTTLVGGPVATIHAASLDIPARSASANVGSAPRVQDGTPSSSVQPNPGSASSQSVHTNDIVPAVTGTPTPASSSTSGSTTSNPSGAAPRVSDQGPLNGRPIVAAPDGQPAAAGSLLVTFKPNATSQSRTDANTQAHAVAADAVGHGNTVRVDVQGSSLADAMAAYAARPDVQSVSPDYALRASMTPNDPSFQDEWGMRKIQAPGAWDRVNGASGVKVAVLDTGVSNHPDLAGRVVLTKDFTNSPNGMNDVVGHGTHTAGTIAANTNNGIGVAGVAFNSSLMVGKVLGDDGVGTISSVANGMVWAADNGAKVISMSLGADITCPSALQDAVSYAWSKGVVVVAAAGNEGVARADTPANCTNAVPIGATDSNDAKSSFSNYGSAVPIAAPGSTILSTGLNGDYMWMSGTSMATPHVAGVAALIWATEYGTSNQAVVARLFSTADKVAGTGRTVSYGRVNAMAAVAASGAAPATPTPAPSVTTTPTTPTTTPSTPTPTTPTPTPSPTQPTNPCSPRPPVSVHATAGAPGQLRVTIGAGTSSTTSTNRLVQVRFGSATNAVIQPDSQAANHGNVDITLPSGADQYSFTVQRAAPGAATTVNLTVVDACGDWPTVVGGGPTAF